MFMQIYAAFVVMKTWNEDYDDNDDDDVMMMIVVVVMAMTVMFE